MLEKISIRDFRNYRGCALEFAAGNNILTGPNGVGKSNLLEAVFFASFLRSFRTQRWRELVRIGASGLELSMTVRDDRWRHRRSVRFEFPERRMLFRDASPVGRASEYVGALRPVVFAPEDREIITGGAGCRRGFFDMLIAVADAGYWQALRDYNSALLRRNAALKGRDETTAAAFEPILAESALALRAGRERWSLRVEDLLRESDPGIAIHYRCDGRNFQGPEEYVKALADARGREMLLGFGTFGPQRDDFEIIYEDKPARSFASTGQGRKLALKLKLAAAELLRRDSRVPVIALVDDVTGDLDESGREEFYRRLESIPQRIFTFTAVPERFRSARIFEFSAPGCPTPR